MKKYKKVFKLFAVGEEEKECKWLEQMSKKGYHLTNVSFACYYTFEKGEPNEYSYMIDMMENNSIDEGEYLVIYSDCDLKYIDKSKGFYYFRSENKENMNKIKNIEQGRYADRLKSQSKLILTVALMNILISIMLALNTFINKNTHSSWIFCINLFLGLMLLYIYYNINKKIKEINKSGSKALYTTTLKDWKGLYPIFIICVILILVYGTLTLLNI